VNRLADETSPYLRQHRDNPVDWYPWGEEAFARARSEDRPVLLSVGYAACHWCHVMAHESFEDEATAAVMNELFVSVKVDREERPDVDAVYMEAVQALTGRGGWPMTVFLTPEGLPFFGGTYYPSKPRGGLPAFSDLCRAIDSAWRERRQEVMTQAHQLRSTIGQAAELSPAGRTADGSPGAVIGPPEGSVLVRARDVLGARFDPEWGGFGPAPKFPQTDSLELLLRMATTGRRTSPGATEMKMVNTTLDAMAAGGIYDHLGGGFHRYATDPHWLVPHFEKMLYDQALIARAYLHAWQVTGESRHLQVLTETIDYVRRDLRHPQGGFYSSEDADSEGEEGRFYVWTAGQLDALLDSDAAEAKSWWGVTPAGNFEGANILHRPDRANLARSESLERSRITLFENRKTRIRPALDDKILTEWNAMFVATLAEAAAATGRNDWLADAETAADFLIAHLRRPDGRWLRSWQGSSAPSAPGDQEPPSGARHLGYAADYAALADAFTRLAEASGRARWIAEARSAADGLIELFWDHKNGGVFTTGEDADPLITRPKDILDGAIPSANGTSALVLLRLGTLVDEESYRRRAHEIASLLAGPAEQHPAAFCHLLAAVDLIAAGATEIVVVGERPDLVEAVRRRYLPRAVLAWGEPYASPLFEGRTESFAYVCSGYTCLSPAGSVDELESLLDGI